MVTHESLWPQAGSLRRHHHHHHHHGRRRSRRSLDDHSRSHGHNGVGLVYSQNHE